MHVSLYRWISGKNFLNQYAIRLDDHGAVFHIHYWGVVPKHFDNPTHKPSFFEVCYVVDGNGTYIDDGVNYPLKENVMFFSRPGILHQIKSESGLYLLYVGFELLKSQSKEKWIRRMEEAEQCPEVVKPVQYDITASSLWKSLLIQAAQPIHGFFEELLTHLAYALILSLLQTFVPYLQNDDHKTSAKTSSLLLNQ
ncbi:AraC-like ligand binding domain-containing protein [Melghirimyces thermohalophilus]|uniref:AraC-like ligand binding domain-containing protein n=1 Tax=Melghirimyces thermohalophilus TaxID=1236220 RepID=A0A1G6L9W8_9BACL|nr:AraC family ligand binding domain-containing protein [Melghirimyces thermohalophilus]SDC40100.1 AraC-like ligand binding domain-containing protein [Melghirimyces thermohalophilus]